MHWVRLGDIASKITKGTTPTSIGYDFVDEGINFIKIESITENGTFLQNKFAHITSECNEKLGRSQLNVNDILFSIAGAIGRTAIVSEDILPANTNQAIAIIRVPEGSIDYSFLMYALESPALRKQYESQKQGVAQINLSLQNVSDFLIPKFGLDEQRRIAAVLDKVSCLIAKRREQLDKLDELVKARFVEMFGDPLLDSGKYPKVPLGSLAEVGSSKRIFEKEYVSEGVPFYRTKEIVELSKGNRITTELFITRERYDEIRREYGVPQTGDLLISAVGTIGVIWIVDGKNDFYFKDGNLLRVATSEKFVPIYLKYLLESLIGAYKLEMSSGTAYAALTISALKEILVYEVPLAEQEQFATFVKQIDKSKLTIQQSLDKLEVLKKALMQQYFG